LNSKTEPKKTTINVPAGPFTLDLGVTSPEESTSVSVKTIPLTSDEQRVRLNLAKSYVKIKDLETARILLNDLMNLGSEIETTILEEVKKILLDLGE
jgi:FimV-like protein